VGRGKEDPPPGAWLTATGIRLWREGCHGETTIPHGEWLPRFPPKARPSMIRPWSRV
jgi:hypothetical protein